MIRTTHVRLGAALTVAIVLIAGCTDRRKEEPNLPLACETTECICIKDKQPVWQKNIETPVLWRQTGEAYCPEDFVLRLAPK
jgi:type IV pilus biogenesis protein CpaD/CtpE